MRKRRDYSYAKICLEAWAFWMIGDHGFSSRSAIARIGEPSSPNFGSSMPNGVLPKDRAVDHANTVLAVMNGSCDSSAERAHILKVITRNQQGGETIAQTFERLGIDQPTRLYHSALEEFAIRLEVLVYGRNRKAG